MIYVSSYMPDLALIVRTLRESGIDVPIIGGDSYDDPALFEALGPEYGNDVDFDTHGYLSAERHPKYTEFAKPTKRSSGSRRMPSGSCPATTCDGSRQAPWRLPARPTAPVAKAMEEQLRPADRRARLV